jgi:hypothetical protein
VMRIVTATPHGLLTPVPWKWPRRSRSERSVIRKLRSGTRTHSQRIGPTRSRRPNWVDAPVYIVRVRETTVCHESDLLLSSGLAGDGDRPGGTHAETEGAQKLDSICDWFASSRAAFESATRARWSKARIHSRSAMPSRRRVFAGSERSGVVEGSMRERMRRAAVDLPEPIGPRRMRTG